MGEANTIGIDIAKSVFQIHGVDADGTVVIRKRVSRAKFLEFFADLPPCVVGMEACATAHRWARELKKLGHDTRLMPPTYVKAYVKRGKNDAADAAAICEAVTRPSMRFVPIKSVEQQSALMLHRTRDLLIRQRTQLINALRAHLAELGLVAAKGREGLQQLVIAVTESSDERLPSNARFACQSIVAQLHAVQTQVNGFDKRITQAHRANADSKRLDAIPGFGVILSAAVVATMTDPKAFKTGREFAAWIGAAAELDRWKGTPRLDFQAGRSLPTTTIGRWCNIHCQDRPDATAQISLGDRTAGSSAGQGGRGSAGQQDGADRLGGAGQGRDLSGTGTLWQRRHRCSGLRARHCNVNKCETRRGRTGKSRVMMV
jgi:transposase